MQGLYINTATSLLQPNCSSTDTKSWDFPSHIKSTRAFRKFVITAEYIWSLYANVVKLAVQL